MVRLGETNQYGSTLLVLNVPALNELYSLKFYEDTNNFDIFYHSTITNYYLVYDSQQLAHNKDIIRGDGKGCN